MARSIMWMMVALAMIPGMLGPNVFDYSHWEDGVITLLLTLVVVAACGVEVVRSAVRR